MSPQLTDKDIGESFVAIGYGVHDTSLMPGPRTMGNATLSHLDGSPWSALLGPFDTAVRELEDEFDRPLTDVELANLRAKYELHLLPEYEAYFLPRDGNVQVCTGDSGGPLLRRSRASCWCSASRAGFSSMDSATEERSMRASVRRLLRCSPGRRAAERPFPVVATEAPLFDVLLRTKELHA